MNSAPNGILIVSHGDCEGLNTITVWAFGVFMVERTVPGVIAQTQAGNSVIYSDGFNGAEGLHRAKEIHCKITEAMIAGEKVVELP